MPPSQEVNLGDVGLDNGENVSPFIDEYWNDDVRVIVPAGDYDWDGTGMDGKTFSDDAELVGDGTVDFHRVDTPNDPNMEATGTSHVIIENINIIGITDETGDPNSRIRGEADIDAQFDYVDLRIPDIGSTISDTEAGGWYSPSSHDGIIRWISCECNYAGNNAIYASSPDFGKCVVLGGIYRNNNVASVRVGGVSPDNHDYNFEIDDVVIHNDDQAPARDNPEESSGQNQRGVRFDEPGDGRMDNVHITFDNPDVPTNGPIAVSSDGSGGSCIAGTVYVWNDTDTDAVNDRGNSYTLDGVELNLTGSGNLDYFGTWDTVLTGADAEEPSTTELGTTTLEHAEIEIDSVTADDPFRYQFVVEDTVEAEASINELEGETNDTVDTLSDTELVAEGRTGNNESDLWEFRGRITSFTVLEGDISWVDFYYQGTEVDSLVGLEFPDVEELVAPTLENVELASAGDDLFVQWRDPVTSKDGYRVYHEHDSQGFVQEAELGPRYALSFDGTDDYIALAKAYSTQGFLDTLTVAAWVEVPSDGGDAAVIDFDRSEWWSLAAGVPDGQISGEGSFIRFSTTGQAGAIHDLYSATAIDDGAPHHIACVYDGTEKYIYIDGALDASTSTSPHAGNPLGTGNARYGFIGDGSEATSQDGSRNATHFEGTVGNVRVWDNDVLTSSEIADLADGKVGTGTSTLTNHWALNDGDGTSTFDSVTGDSASIVGATWRDPIDKIGFITSRLLDGEEYDVKVGTFRDPDQEKQSSVVTAPVTNLPDVGALSVDISNKNRPIVSWADVTDAGIYRTQWRRQGTADDTWKHAFDGALTTASQSSEWTSGSDINLNFQSEISQRGTGVEVDIVGDAGGIERNVTWTADIPVDLSGDDAIQFWAWVTGAATDISVRLIDDGGFVSTKVDWGSLVASKDEGQTFEIDLADFGPEVDLTAVAGVRWNFASLSTDDRAFIDSVAHGTYFVGHDTLQNQANFVNLDRYVVDFRTRSGTEHVNGTYSTTTIDEKTEEPPTLEGGGGGGGTEAAPSDFVVPDPAWHEPLSLDATWTNNSDTGDEQYYIQADSGGGFVRVTSDLGSSANSYTLTDAELDYDTTYTLRVEVVLGSGAQAFSNEVTITTPLNRSDPSRKYWLAGIGSQTEVTEKVTDLDFTREHSALSDWSITIPYTQSFETLTFDEAHLMFGDRHLFSGEIQRVESDEQAATTRLSGPGIGTRLTRGETTVTYTNTIAHDALADYLNNHSNLPGTVTPPSAETIGSVQLQKAQGDSTLPFSDVVSIPADIPIEQGSGEVRMLDASWFEEAPSAGFLGTGTRANTAYSGPQVSGDSAEAAYFGGDFGAAGDTMSFTFVPQYDIPANTLAVAWREHPIDNTGDGAVDDLPPFEVRVNGEQLSGFADRWSTVSETVDWRVQDFATYSSAISAGETVTVEFEQTGDTDSTYDEYAIDCAAAFDTRFSFTFDNTITVIGSENTLNGPQPKPDAVRLPFDLAETPFRITFVRLRAVMDDISGNQALGWTTDPLDGSEVWQDKPNAANVDDDVLPVDDAASSIRGSIVFSRYDDPDASSTPTDGTLGQVCSGWEMEVDGDSTGIIDELTLSGNHLENIQRLAERAGARFIVTHGPDPSDWTVDAFGDGDVTATADWDVLNRRREINVRDYANRVVVFGAKQNDGTRLRAEVDSPDEIDAFGETVTLVHTDPSLTNQRDLDNFASVLLGDAIRQDDLTGTIDIMPIPVEPGKSYTIDAWNTTLSLERVSYGVSAGEAVGSLRFSRTSGLGDALSEVEKNARDTRDAV